MGGDSHSNLTRLLISLVSGGNQWSNVIRLDREWLGECSQWLCIGGY